MAGIPGRVTMEGDGPIVKAQRAWGDYRVLATGAVASAR